MTDTFASILDRQASDIERPKPLPIGTYTCIVNGLPRHDKSAKKQTPFVEFQLKVLAPQSDVDQEALTEWATKADGSTRVLTDATVRATFYLTEDSGWRLKKFLEDDLLIESEGKTPRQMLEETTGRQCLVTIKHTPSQDGQSVFAEIANTAPIG